MDVPTGRDNQLDSTRIARDVDEACDRFEAAWRAGAAPRIEEYLAEVEAADRVALLRRLLGLAPKTARLVLPDGREEDLPIASVQPWHTSLARTPLASRKRTSGCALACAHSQISKCLRPPLKDRDMECCIDSAPSA